MNPSNQRGGPAARVWLGAFGKHPAWDDYPDALGEESPGLKKAKEVLLFGGIRELIETGKWEAQVVIPGREAQEWRFLWCEGQEVVAGILWPSHDRGSRGNIRAFPMVVAAQVDLRDPAWVESAVLPVLESLMHALRQVTTPREVAGCLKEAKQTLVNLWEAGSGQEADYAAAATEILRSTETGPETDAGQRLFHALRANFRGVGAGQSVSASRLEAGAAPLRLPAAPGACLAGWLALWRLQVSDQVPLLVVRAGVLPWCDLWGGRVVGESLAVLQKTPAEHPLETEVPYQIEEGFGAAVVAAVAALRVPWGAPEKVTIFGPVPVRYIPRLPGTGGRESWKDRVSRVRKQIPVGRRSATSTPTLRWALVVAGVVGLVVLVLLMSWGGRSSPPRDRVQSNSASISPAPAPPPLSTGSPGSEGIPVVRWYAYVNDHDRWFWLAGDPQAWTQLGSSSRLTNAVSQMVTAAGLPTLEPLKLVGDADARGRLAPDMGRLKARAEPLARAESLRDQTRDLLTNQYPGQRIAELQWLTNTALTGLLPALLDDVRRYQGDLALACAGSTNPPPESPPARSSVVAILAALGAGEQEFSAVSNAWTSWSAVRQRLESFSNAPLTAIALSAQSSLSSETNALRAVEQLRGLSGDADRVLTWMKLHGSQLDLELFKAAEKLPSPTNFAEWTNQATAYLRIPLEEDPRSSLRKALATVEVERQVRDISDPSSKASTSSTSLVDAWRKFQGEWKDLLEVPGINREKPRLKEKSEALQQQYVQIERQASLTWSEMFDLGRLLKQDPLNDPRLDAVWQNYLAQVRAKAGAQGRPPAPAELREWRSKISDVRLALQKLQDQAQGRPWRGTDAGVAPPELREIRVAIENDYYQQLARGCIDARTLGAGPSVEETLVSPEEQKLRDGAVRLWKALQELQATLRTLARQKKIPADLQPIRSPASNARSAASLFPSAVKLSDPARLMALALIVSPEDRPATNAVVSLDGADQSVAWLLEAAVAEEKGGGATADLSGKLSLAGQLKTLDPESRAPDWRGWLENQWKRVPVGAVTSDHITGWITNAHRAGIEPAELPAGLRYAELAGRVRSHLLTAGEADLARWKPEVKQLAGEFAKVNGSASNRMVLQALQALLQGTNSLAGTAWGELGPSKVGARGTAPDQDRIVFDYGGFSLTFRRRESSAGQRWFVAESELSAGQVAQISRGSARAAGMRGKALTSQITGFLNRLPPQLQEPARKEAARTDGSDLFRLPVFGLHQVVPTLDGARFSGLEIRSPRLEARGKDPLPAAANAVHADQPVNFVSPAWAVEIAAGFGCRLPTVSDWREVNAGLPASTAQVCLTPERLRLFDTLAAGMGLATADFWNLMLWSTRPDAASLEDRGGDSGGLFTSVLDPGALTGYLYHWKGNVSELLKDGDKSYVAGGSFASPAGASLDPVEISADALNRGYGDVGLRLVFDWVGERPVDQVRRLAGELTLVP